MALLGHKVVHTELSIAAPPSEVWAVLMDAKGYGAWNPILVQVDGEYREGAQMRYRMRDPKGKESELSSTVVRFEPERLLNQFGGPRGVLTFDHTWRLESERGGTRLIQHEEYRGIGVWFWDPGWVEAAYGKANEGLRDRVLARAAARTSAGDSP